eukprot:Lithocolla_globosa_v1_NODE_416_length_4118_cov_137.390352.p2 type:complete len:517 gc:universal NODE_416_length_4118_cov_137.390352:3503-1953(-)
MRRRGLITTVKAQLKNEAPKLVAPPPPPPPPPSKSVVTINNKTERGLNQIVTEFNERQSAKLASKNRVPDDVRHQMISAIKKVHQNPNQLESRVDLESGLNNIIDGTEFVLDEEIIEDGINLGQARDRIIISIEDLETRLNKSVKQYLRRMVTRHTGFKVQFSAEIRWINQTRSETNISWTPNKNATVFNKEDIQGRVSDMFLKLQKAVEEVEQKGTGWTIEQILTLRINIWRHRPLRGSSYIDLPKCVKDRKACINPKNTDNKCFDYAVLAGLYGYAMGTNKEQINPYKTLNHGLDFSSLTYPVKVSDIKKFEEVNGLSINVYGLKTYKKLDSNQKTEEKYVVHPLRVSHHKVDIPKREPGKVRRFSNELDLLMITSPSVVPVASSLAREHNTHYCAVNNLSRLVSSQISNHKERKYVCRSCLNSFSHEDALKKHQTLCQAINDDVATRMPKKEDQILEFTNFKNQIPVAFVGYSDFEASLAKLDNETDPRNKSKTVKKTVTYSFRVVLPTCLHC